MVQDELPFDVPLISDPRQDRSLQNIERVAKFLGGTVVANTLRGWPASHVNLGWLGDQAKELLRSGFLQTEEDLSDFIKYCVQRSHVLSITKSVCEDEEVREESYRVKLSTNDDFGDYFYEFEITVSYR